MRDADRLFLRCGLREISFAQADAAVDVLACVLLGRGMGQGSRIALLLPSIAEFPLYLLACARIGAVCIPIGTRYTGSEIVDLLRRSRSAMLILGEVADGPDFAARIADAAPGFDPSRRDHCGGSVLPDLSCAIRVPDPVGASTLLLPDESETGREALAAAEAAVEIHDPVVVVYTSGTSGVPKGAVHTHAMLRNCTNMVRAFAITRDDRILGHMPLYHVAGLCAALIPPLLSGASVTLVRSWDAASVAALIERERITMFGGIPTHYVDLLDAVAEGGFDTSSLRTAWIGGATISPELARRAVDELGLGGLQAIYGMTETTSTTTLTPIGDDLMRVCENKGKPIGDFEIAVVDPGTGQCCAVGAAGEVRVRGYLVMAGYLDDPEATAQAIDADGWFHTGDLGAFDDQGYLQIRGRLKDVFRVGGSTVSPAEVEAAIAKLDGVRQSVVVGVADPRLGEVGFAFIQPVQAGAVTRAEIDAHLRDRLAGYKRPRFVRFVDAFPMTSTGKLRREELRRIAGEEASAAQAAA
ncbi:AMP-binding protein [Sphingomonas sp. AOB5]|uniref:class I adenylate-forming enzyme family protein n=1 Tax=Sphingomonas sp. AOB5 TaxID=3034017 RepID=UPI0023F71F7E|nr:AMP-binding protein [Sphingomonas sp. AOB5]MDF7774824.1 AMP-binding protein [Sphingomonas sp. AOB5]